MHYSFNNKYEIFDPRIAIGILVDWENKIKVRNLYSMIRSIDYFNTTNILLFSDTDPVSKDFQDLTHHKIHYVPIMFHFPKGFNSSAKSPYKGRTKWGYIHMCKFWFKDVWQLPILRRFRYLMRFDTDSCMIDKKFKLNLHEQYKYLHAEYMYEYSYIDDLNKTIFQYISEYNITPKNPDLFKVYLQTKGELPMWYNNVEITDIDFMLSLEVQNFLNMIDVTHGQYKYRWGDAPLRYATMAIFTSRGEVTSLGMKSSYKHPC